MDTIVRAKPVGGQGHLHPLGHAVEHHGAGRPARHGGVPMSKTERQATVEALTEQLKGSPNVYVTDFTGLNVLRMTELRRRLRTAGRRVRRGEEHAGAARLRRQRRQRAGRAPHRPDRPGPRRARIPVAAAKVLTDFAKEFEKPAIKIGLVDGKPVTPAQVKRLAKLPPREVLLSQLAGYIQAPMAQFAGAMNGLLYQMVGALEALRAQRQCCFLTGRRETPSWPPPR